jgi:hypothetical protein
VDPEVHATAGQEAGATRLAALGKFNCHAVELDTIGKDALGFAKG